MLTIKPVSLKPVTQTIEGHDVTVTIRRATLADEGQRYAMLFAERETAMITDIAIVEAYLTLVECDIVTEDEEPLLQAGMSYEEFVAGMTAIWQYSADLFWKMHDSRARGQPSLEPAHGGKRTERLILGLHEYLDLAEAAANTGQPPPAAPWIWRLYRLWREWGVSPLELL